MDPITINLLAHILLDSESSGRFGVQGNTFRNTFNYLNQYFKTLAPEKRAEILPLAKGMDDLVSLEYSVSRTSNSNDLDWLMKHINGQISSLSPNQTGLIPGGWRGIDSPGHAMIYQFEKTADEGLRFSIFNAGSGIKYHEKTSSTEKELFSPVKTYTLPPPVNSTELSQLIKRLIVPQLSAEHPARKQRKFDAETLYRDIDISLAFLKAKLVPQDLSQPHATTAGQLSGTCTQRSIHQMLKVTLGDRPNYQRIIFDFKMHALNHFINTHPAPPRSLKITAFLQKAITNNLRILQEENGLTPAEKDTAIQQLTALQQQLNGLIPKSELLTNEQTTQPPTPIVTHKLEMGITSFPTPATQIPPLKSAPPRRMPLNPDTLFADLDALIQACTAEQANNPLWVMDQIEQALLKLPIPDTTQKDKPYFPTIDFYRSITTQEHFEKIETTLDALQNLYINACSSMLKDSTIPSQFVTEYSFFVLRDYFDVKGEEVTGKPNFHPQLYHSIAYTLSRLTNSPYLATDNPAFDHRMNQLLKGFSHSDLKLTADRSSDAYYPSFLDRYPELQHSLSDEYKNSYANNHAPFHQSLREKKLTALYMLLEQMDSNYQFKPNATLKNNPQAALLIKQLKRQHALEQFFTRGGNLLSGTDHRRTSLKIEKEDYTNNATVEWPDLDVHLGDISEHSSITSHKYNLGPSPALNALLQGQNAADMNDKWSSFKDYQNPDFGTSRIFERLHLTGNAVQVVPHEANQHNRIISKDDYFMRDLFHLRLVPEQQINLTLDYFSKTESIGKLDDPNVQAYVEANLFQPGLLLTALHDDPTFLFRIDAFINKGLTYFAEADNLLNAQSLFFVRLRTLVHNYAGHTLQTDQRWLSKLIEQHQDPETLASLHTYRFFNAITQYQLDPDHGDATLLSHALESWFYMQTYQSPHDTASRVDQQRAGLDFNAWLQTADPDIVQSLIKPIMCRLLPELDDADLTLSDNQHPVYQVIDNKTNKQYTFNAEKGRIFQNNHAFGPVPLELINHPVLRRLGQDHAPSCLLHEDGQTCSFTHPDRVRIKIDNGRLVVQKEWRPGQWYQLKALTDEQQYRFNIGSGYSPKDSLPAILTDDSMDAWIGDTDAFLAEHGHAVYQVDQQGVFHALDEQGIQTGHVLTSTPPTYTDTFSRFEDRGFFKVNLDETTRENGTVDFARYGFSLTISGKKITLPGTAYALLPPESSVFSPEIAALQFSNGTEQQCIVAVQPFYVDPNTSQTAGNYYQLTQDISGFIPTEILTKHQKEGHIKNLPPQWNHHDSAQTITYKIVNGEPRPDTAADALYLCYLYLATHDVDKAWAVLDDINQRLGLTGSMDEITYLSWIVQYLPVILTNDDNLGLKHETPDYVACQLKALALYTDFLTLNEPPVFPNDHLFDKTRRNGHYDAICLAKTKNFHAKLPSTIQSLYSRHQRGTRHLHEKHTLRDDECLSLLNYCSPKSSNPDEKPVALGALGYERQRLSLIKLLKEYRRLEAIQLADATSGNPLPNAFAKRMRDIKQHITKAIHVAKKRTRLEKIPINLSLRSFMTESLLSDSSQDIVRSWSSNGIKPKTKPADALSALNSGIEQEDFIAHFPTLLDMARTGTPEQKAQLEQFCIPYLTGARHVALDKQDTNSPGLTNILYRVLNNPDKCPVHSSKSKLTIDTLTHEASQWDVPPIDVFQTQDVYDDILTDNQAIWDALETTIPTFCPMPPLEPIYSKSLALVLGIDEHCNAYRQLELQYQTTLNALIKSMQGMTEPTHVQAVEEKAGQLKFNCITAQRNMAEDILKSADTRAALTTGVQTLQTTQKPVLKKLWEDSLSLANQIINEPSSSRHLELLAAQRHALTQQELLVLYLHADSALYREKTGLSPSECERLHQRIHQTIALEIRQQQVTRLASALEQAGTSGTPQPDHLYQIANALISENVHQAQTDPGLMLFQYAENLLVHPRQAEALGSLLSTSDDPHSVNNSIEKVIMGGGKSKVILPLLAEKKATGTNLVVVEVPRSLLATNHADLNSTSRRLFDQKAHRFEFNRDSDCSPKRLQTIYQTFRGIMTNREYLVTTGESMQSLELKYLDLLLNRPDDPAAQQRWEQQVYWASKITALIKQHGDVVMDEVHQGLLLKKKLNYTLGNPIPIDSKLIQHSIALYQFANHLGHTPTADDFLLHPNSPLRSYFRMLNPQLNPEKNAELRQQLRAFFNNESMPAFIEQAVPEIQDAFAFYKEQQTLLPQTQSRHYKEHYGPSETQPNVLKRALAIPYAASNRPNERSRFGNTLETMNYTIQSRLAEGLHEDLLKEAIEQWQSAARSEHLSGEYATLNDTPTAQRINPLLNGTGLTVQTINLRRKGQLTALCKKLKNNETLLYTLLEEQILPQITVEPALLHSDAYAHVDMYRSAQGISGTPWNHSTYHQRLIYNQQTSLGTDGFIQTVLKNKRTSVSHVKFEKPGQFLKQILDTRDNVRAIIDISAMFAGISNLNVATQLARCAIGQHKPKALRYILYFNAQDVLCALDVTSLGKPIILATSDPIKINQMLGCTPDERLTYYDQSHTVGTDLKQGSAAHAIVLADNKTHLQSFLQGCMRMRGLAEQQTVSIIVPENTPTSLNEFISLMSKNEQDQLKEDNFFAAVAKMANIVRNDLLQRLNAVPETDYETKHKMAQFFQHHFIETKPATLFAQYGGICVLQNTETLLQDHATALITDWTRCLSHAAGKPPESKDADALSTSLSEIIMQSIPLCNVKSMRRANHLAQETEQQQEALKEMLAQQEMQQEASCFSSTLMPKARLKDTALPVLDAFMKTGTAPCMQPLNTACGSKQDLFSSQLLVNDHYIQVYEGQKHMLCSYLKPSLAILFRKDGETITACLIDMEDVAEFKAHIASKKQKPQIWISTTQHRCLAGALPDNLLDNANYQSLIEQIRFFNGECMGLREQITEQKTPLHWLNQKTNDKLTWFEQNIMPYRQTTLSALKQLQSVLKTTPIPVVPRHYVDKHADESIRITHTFKAKKTKSNLDAADKTQPSKNKPY